MTFMFHQSNWRDCLCRLPGFIHDPHKSLLVLSSNNEQMSQFLVAWPFPGNHSSANNRAPLKPCSVHVRCLLFMSYIIISVGDMSRAMHSLKEACKVRANFCSCSPCMLSTGSEKRQDVSARKGWWMSGKPHSDTQKKISTKKLYLVSSVAS